MDIAALEKATRDYRDTRAALENFARKISKIRHPEKNINNYGMTHWRRTTGSEFDDMDVSIENSYSPDTDVIEVYFHHGRWNEDHHVVFPTHYFRPDFDFEIERQEIERKRNEYNERERVKKEQQAAEEKARDLPRRQKLYEELKKEFG